MSLRKLFLTVALSAFSSVPAGTPPPEQAVIVTFDYGNRDWSPFFRFEHEFESAVKKAGIGEYDGNELAVDGSDGSLYFYGPDADRIFAAVKPLLLQAPFMKNIRVTIRYGAASDKSARQVVVNVAP